MTFQDYYTGGELTKLIYKYGGLPASKAKNLAAQLVCVSLTAYTRNLSLTHISVGSCYCGAAQAPHRPPRHQAG